MINLIGNTILLAEDDANDVFFFRRALEKCALSGVALKVVGDGEAAISYLSGLGSFGVREEHPVPNLIFLDLKMPRTSGLEVLAWLRQQTTLQYVPTVVLTSSKHAIDIEQSYRLRANSYLIKPVQADELAGLLKLTTAYWLTMNQIPESAF